MLWSECLCLSKLHVGILISKADLENHNKDGGFWTVIDGKVYDIKDFQTQSLTGNSILGKASLFTSWLEVADVLF